METTIDYLRRQLSVALAFKKAALDVLGKIAQPALGGKHQQYLAQNFLSNNDMVDEVSSPAESREEGENG